MRTYSIRHITVFLLISVIGGVLHAGMPRFYLSTDKIYNSREDLLLKVESRNIKKLDLRIYRIKNPIRFFLKQKNIYRVKGYGKRVAGFKQLSSLFLGAVRNSMAYQCKKMFNYQKISKKMRKDMKQFFTVMDKKKVKPVQGYLRAFPLVKEMKVNLSQQDSGWTRDLISLPIFKKGVYLVEGVVGKEASYCVAAVSDLAILSKHGGRAAVYYAVDRQSGEPRRSKIVLHKEGERSARLYLNKKGWAVTKRRPFLLGRVFALSSSGEDFAVHDSTYYPSSSFGIDPLKVYLYTDRPMYKPGQALYYKGILRKYRKQRYYSSYLMGRMLRVRFVSSSGSVVSQQTVRVGQFGSISGGWRIPTSARPGLYRLVVQVGAKKYESMFRVKHYVKPPFEIHIVPKKKAFSFNERIQGVIQARYFFGGAVRGGEVRYYVYRQQRFQSQYLGEPFGWYLRDNEYRNTREELVYEGKGTTDDTGRLRFDFLANTANLKGKAYNYRIEVRIKDSSGKLVMGSGMFRVLEGDYYLMIQSKKNYYRPGERALFSVKGFSYAGGKAKPKVDFSIVYYKWDQYSMAQAAQKVVIYRRSLNLARSSSVAYRFRRAGNYYVRVVSTDKSGNKIRSGRFIWVAGNANSLAISSTGLKIVPDKKVYTPGERAKVLVLSPVPDIKVFYTVEGDGLYRYGTFRLRGNSKLFSLPISRDMAPNCYLNLMFVFNDRVYTSRKQLFVPPRKRFLSITLNGLKKNYQPGERVSCGVTVKDGAGRGVKAELSVAVTDEAIYSLQRKLVLDIEKFFYHPHRNSVIFASSYYTRFYGYAEQDRLEMARLRRGNLLLADLNKGKARQFVDGGRKKFKDRAWWSAKLTTNRYGKGKISFTLPDNITRWRMSINACDKREKVGSGRFRFVASKQFFLKPVLPVVMMENDTVVVSAIVHNRLTKSASAKVRLKVDAAKLLSSVVKRVTIPANSARVISWRLKPTQLGKLQCRFELRGPLSDSVVRSVKVLPFARRIYQNWSVPLYASGPLKFRFSLPKGARLKDAYFKVRVTPKLMALIEDSAKFLIGYPYGCVEQTLSKFLPNLYVMKMLGTFTFRDKSLKKKLPKLIEIGINRLRTMQNSNGSWGWFTGGRSDLLMSTYAVYGLSLAYKLGYRRAVRSMLRRGAVYLRRSLRNPSLRSLALKAFVLYVLQKVAGQHDTQISTAINMLRPKNTMASILLADAALRTPYRRKADKIIKRLLASAQTRVVGSNVRTLSVGGDMRSAVWSRDAIMQNAFFLRLLVKQGGTHLREKCQQLVNYLLSVRKGQGWRSTMDTSFIMLAFAEYMKKYQQRSPRARTKIELNDKEVVSAPNQSGKLLAFPVNALRYGFNQVTVQGADGYYFSGSLSYNSRQPKFNRASKGGIQITRQYYSLVKNGQAKYRIDSHLSSTMPKGKTILVRVRIRTQRPLDYFMLDEPLPTGFQFVEEKDDSLVRNVRLNDYLSHEKYPDRVVFFKRFLRPGVTEIAYLLYPAVKGEFNVLPAVGGSMYYPEFKGNSASTHFKVVGE